MPEPRDAQLRFAFVPAYAPPDRPQEIRLVFNDRTPGYFATPLTAPDLDSAETFCDRANAIAGHDPESWRSVMATSIRPRRSAIAPPVRLLTAPLDHAPVDTRAVPLPSRYFFLPSRRPEHDPQRLFLVFHRYPAALPTAIGTANLRDAAMLSDLLNTRLPPIPQQFSLPDPPSRTLH